MHTHTRTMLMTGDPDESLGGFSVSLKYNSKSELHKTSARLSTQHNGYSHHLTNA